MLVWWHGLLHAVGLLAFENGGRRIRRSALRSGATGRKGILKRHAMASRRGGGNGALYDGRMTGVSAVVLFMFSLGRFVG